MLRFIKLEWKFLVLIAVLFLVMGFIYYLYNDYKANLHKPAQVYPPNITINTSGEQSKQGETKVVYIQGEGKETKEIVYVPKYVDPQTGQPEKTDVEFERKQNKVYVKVNGKEYEVPTIVEENTKFEKGKLVVTEQTEMKINITAPKPMFNLGVGWSKNGAALQANGPVVKNVGWWMYGDKSTIAGGLQFPIMK